MPDHADHTGPHPTTRTPYCRSYENLNRSALEGRYHDVGIDDLYEALTHLVGSYVDQGLIDANPLSTPPLPYHALQALINVVDAMLSQRTMGADTALHALDALATVALCPLVSGLR